MQVSGLAHILYGSGLHMVLVAGSVFAICRWLLALTPALALRFPVKKPAAALALLAAAFYLLFPAPACRRSALSPDDRGGAAGGHRSDRDPCPGQACRWSAVVVLLLRPEAAVGASSPTPRSRPSWP